MADKGSGVSVTFDSSYFAAAESVDWSGINRAAIPTTTLATTGGMTFEPSEIYDPGEITITGLLAPGVTPGIISLDAPETLTVTWTNADLSTWAASAFMTSIQAQASEAEERTRYTATCKFSGNITVTL